MTRLGSGIGGHQRTQGVSDDWLTPPDILHALGEFDLDPCASTGQPWRTAKTQYVVKDDGLAKMWFGRVWLNPPYGRETWKWMSRLAEHGNGIALVFARTETEMFHRLVWERAAALLFLENRLSFHLPVTGKRSGKNAGAPSVLVAYGAFNVDILAKSRIKGAFVRLR